MPGPVLVLGAGGKLGLTLALMLKKAAALAARPGLRVIAVSRFQDARARERFDSAGIGTLPCDLADEDAVRALPEAPAVFFLAGQKFGTAASPALLEKHNVLAPRLVARRFRRSRIAVFSTGCVYPFVPVGAAGATEQTPPAPVGDYAISCLRREEEFDAIARDPGATARVVNIRLNYAVELRYGVLLDIAARVREGRPVDIATSHVNVIWQTDAIAHIIRSLELAARPAATINITGPAALRVRDIAGDFGRLFGKAPLFTGVETPAAWLSDASRSHRLFGAPPTPLATMERWIAAWLESGGETWNKPTGFENRDGKF